MKGKLFPEVCFLSCLMLLQGCATAAPTSTNQTGFRLTVELQDGSRIIGKSGDETFQFRSDVLGELKLPLEKIRSIECQPKTNSVKLATANGDALAVEFLTKEIRMEATFGNFKLPVNLIRRVKVMSMARPLEIKPGLIALWPGESNADDLLNNNNGSIGGNTSFISGKTGQAFCFDGVDSFIKIPSSPSLDAGDQITIAFWMKTDPKNSMSDYQGLVTSDSYGIEISNGGGGETGVNFYLHTTANQPMGLSGSGMRFASAANFSCVSDSNGGGARVTGDQWHHVAGTYDGTKLQLYIDGRLWGNPAFHTGKILPMLPNSFVAIGSEDGRTTAPNCIATRYFNGLIDEVKIFKRALTSSEIQTMCVEENNDEPLPPPPTSPRIKPSGGKYRDFSKN